MKAVMQTHANMVKIKRDLTPLGLRRLLLLLLLLVILGLVTVIGVTGVTGVIGLGDDPPGVAC
jgi:hypothetical protein